MGANRAAKSGHSNLPLAGSGFSGVAGGISKTHGFPSRVTRILSPL